MQFTITASTTPACMNYLHIIYNGKEYRLEDFSEQFKSGDFSLDAKLKDCDIDYRGYIRTYDKMCQDHVEFSKTLKFFTRYSEEIRQIEPAILLSNNDYYKAAKFLGKAEDCLQTARYYLISSEKILTTDFDVNWKSGYIAQFIFRTMDFKTAVVWYNNCFDYVLQIIYLAFGLYKKVSGYNNLTFEEILKKCRFEVLEKIYNKNLSVSNFSDLWSIITKCHNALASVNEWANFIKHKGGISFVGATPPNPFSMYITDVKGNIVAESSEYNSVELDLDESIKLLQQVHEALYNCLDELVTFINFSEAMPDFDLKKDKRLIPNKSNYVKVILPDT